MKQLLSSTLALILTTLLSLPGSADAFSRRPQPSEVGQNQVRTTQLENDKPTVSAPEPSSAMILGSGLGIFGLYSLYRRFKMRQIGK